MSISLFPHNQTTYESLPKVLETEHRACIIHPTGTGKSFIGFKYCEDHLDQAVLWLSPSEYIFKTQCESLRATGTELPGNISFMTYAKLSQLEPEELDGLHPDAIVLDEMHRAAAPTWELPVQTLISKQNPIVIGLTATNIHYLDNQKDTTQTFNMNIASQMTLGEAIVRGILNPPKYVLSLFSYKNDLEKYESRVQQAKSKAVRDKGEEYLEALRRALDKAEGMDEIFRKHMSDRHGKYLVFCSNIEHMDEMIDKVPEWFGKVDAKPHVYRAYSADLSTNKAFTDFKEDNSEHLKLLFCIDMLNEGVHVDDVNGVILLRPTISPIVYKQQIGRAMSASKKKNAVIFDIVLNIENLYSIGSIEEEMQAAMTYYRSLGLDYEIVNEHFKVIDEVRDCMELFEKLNDTLTASWDLMYVEAKKYYAENSDLNVPTSYVTAQGYSLGQWLATQRRVRAGRVSGNLSDEQIKLLDLLGMRWGSVLDQSWERNYNAAKLYFERYGDLLVNSKYNTNDGLKLGYWITNLRTYRKSGIKSNYLTEERIQALDEIGMQWDVPDYVFERNYAAAMEYHREHGDLFVPANYVDTNGLRLGAWISYLQTHYRKGTLQLTQDQVDRLDELGMPRNGRYAHDWEAALEEFRHYVQKNQSADVPVTFQTATGLRLGRWIRHQRELASSDRLSPERKSRLNEIAPDWLAPQSYFDTCFKAAEDYFRTHQNLLVPASFVTEDGIKLGQWIASLRKRHRKGELDEEQIQSLNQLGMDWRNQTEVKQEPYFEALLQWVRESGNADIPKNYITENGIKLGKWIYEQQQRYRNGSLSSEYVERLTAIAPHGKLDELGFVLGSKHDLAWDAAFRELQGYFKEHGNLNLPFKYTTASGFQLERWLYEQKKAAASGRLKPERWKRLDALDPAWQKLKAPSRITEAANTRGVIAAP